MLAQDCCIRRFSYFVRETSVEKHAYIEQEKQAYNMFSKSPSGKNKCDEQEKRSTTFFIH